MLAERYVTMRGVRYHHAILLFAAVLAAQNVKSIEGQWAGTAQDGADDAISVVVRVVRTPAGELRGTVDSLKHGIYGLPVQTVTLTGDSVRFDVPAAHASFEGKLAGDRIAGQWKRDALVVPFVFVRQTASTEPPRTAVPIPTTPHIGQWMDDDGVEVPTPPREHPSLYLRARDLDDLRRRTVHPVLKPVWDRMQKRARENVQARLEVDAIRYLLDRDDALGRRTAADAVDTLEHAAFPMDVEDISRQIGRMMVTGAMVYDWCYAVLTAEQKQRFAAQEVRLAKLTEVGYPPMDGGYVAAHASEWMIMRDQLSAGVALYDEFPEMYRYAANRFFKGHLPARDFWNQGHAFHQSSAYAETRFSSELYPLFIFDRMGFGNVYNPAQQFVPYSWIYMRRPDGQLLRGGDGQSISPRLRSLLTASYYGDGYILADYLRKPGIDGMSEIYELLWRDPDLKPLPLTDLPLSRYMGSPYGWMVARTGWNTDAVIAEMKVNIFNFNDHQHLDAGAFQIYYRGALAIDSGLYEGQNGKFGSPHHVNYNTRTIAHNSLLIYDPEEKFERAAVKYRNDGGQRMPNRRRPPSTLAQLLSGDFRTGEVLGEGFGPDPERPEYTYLKGDLTKAYSGKVREVKRSFVFLNLGGEASPAVLIVFDKVTASNPAFKKYWLLHSMEEPQVRGNATTVSRGGRLINTTLLPEANNLEIAKVGGPGKEFWVFGENFPNQPEAGANPANFETGAWRIEVSPRAPSATDCFLNVMQITGASEPPAVEKLTAKGMTGVRVADRVVWFQTDGERSARAVKFTASGGGTMKFLVTDLGEGTWQVWRDGKIVRPAVRVAESEGTMYFEGPAGAYELRR